MSNDEDTYVQAFKYPLAKVVLEALHTQDVRSYNGDAGDIGKLALKTAEKIRELLHKKA